MKKEYKAPVLRTVKINEPLAYACTVYNASCAPPEGCEGRWSGCNLATALSFSC